MDLSVIIVNYNTCELTIQALDSVFQNTRGLEFEVFVVDNASVDESIETIRMCYPQVTIIANDANLGFAAANNKAIALASGQYILLLNSDTIVQEDCLSRCVMYLNRHPETGALGCRILLADGQLDHACKRGFPTPQASLFYFLKLHKLFPYSRYFGQYTLDYISEDSISEVDAITGAFMMVRKETIEEIGLLDEDFFMYGEDLDWCYRIKAAGWKIIYFPEARIIHLKGGSGGRKSRKSIFEFHQSMRLFYDKHYVQIYPVWVRYMVYGAIKIRYFVDILLNRVKK